MLAAAAAAAAQSVPPVVESPSPAPPTSSVASPSPFPSGPSPSPSPSPTPSPFVPSLPPQTIARLESILTSAMARLGIPGLSAAVVTDRRLRWSAAYGVADLENAVPARTTSVFRLASVTKPITATAILQLVEARTVNLDAPIQRYVPSFPAKPWPVTVRHLLCHQSGIRNWTDAEFHSTRRYGTIADTLVLFRDDPLRFRPGTRTEYTSLGYELLGAVVEGVSAKPFARYLGEHVFRPAGMESTRVDDVLAIIPGRARGYRRSGEGAMTNSPLSDVSNRVAGGGLAGTAEDVARFAAAFQRGVLVKPATARAAFGRQPTADRKLTGYGLGWIVGAAGGRTEVYHTGGQPKVSTVLYMVPRSGIAVVLLCNLEGVHTQLLDVAREAAAVLRRPAQPR